MNREIKFRVWMPRMKRFCCGGPFKVTDIRHDETGSYVTDSHPSDPDFAHVDDPTNIQQFTGMKDSNGNEIYEGDLVSWNKKKPKDIMAVKITKPYPSAICDSVCLVSLTHDYAKDEDVEVANDIQRVRDVWHHDFRLKIVGNMFENPDLFK